MKTDKKARKLYVNGVEIEVTEEVYRVIKRNEDREAQRRYRAWRCRDGKGVRCKKRCEECEYYLMGNKPMGSDLSIEQMVDEEGKGYDIAAPSANVEVEVARRILRADLQKARLSLSDRDRELFDLLLDEKSEREIASKLGVSNSRAHALKVALFKKLRRLLSAYEGFFG